MKTLIYVFLSAILLISCQERVIEANYNIIPRLQNVQLSDETPFVLNKDASICFDTENKELVQIAVFLNEYISQSIGDSLKYNTVGNRSIHLAINSDTEEEEGYSININSQLINIEAKQPAGLFYAIQTIRKSIGVQQGNSILFKTGVIEDYPRFAYRGMHLDVSRHFFSIDYLKKHIDILSLHNINKFHLHLTDDQGWRIEIKKYPKLTEIVSIREKTKIGFVEPIYDETQYGGYYTQEELKNLVAYAQKRHIEIIPEIDLPGHMLAALASYPELGCSGGPYKVSPDWGIFSDVLCAGNEETYTFIENVLSEVFDIFPSKYIHIGGDECLKKKWKECPKCQSKIKSLNLKDDAQYSKESKLQSYLTHRLEEFVTAKGKQFIGWDEIIEGGLAPNAIVMSWRGKEGAKIAAQAGHEVVICPNSNLYFDYYQTENTKTESDAFPEVNSLEEVYNFDPIPEDISEKDLKNIIGIQANLWTELISTTEHVEYMTLPRLAALSELQWSSAEQNNYSDFLDRLKYLTQIYDEQKYNYATVAYAPQVLWTKDANDLTQVTMSTYDNADIYYTLDGTAPTEQSKKYATPFSIEGKGILSARAIRSVDSLDKNLYVEDYNINKATSKKIATLKPISKYFNPSRGIELLVDGLRGNGCHIFGNPTSWVGFGSMMEVVIDLAKIQKISSVLTGVLLVPNSQQVEYMISISRDGKDYVEVYKKAEIFTGTKDLIATFSDTEARYVKIYVSSANHEHVLSDEIIIE